MGEGVRGLLASRSLRGEGRRTSKREERESYYTSSIAASALERTASCESHCKVSTLILHEHDTEWPARTLKCQCLRCEGGVHKASSESPLKFSFWVRSPGPTVAPAQAAAGPLAIVRRPGRTGTLALSLSVIYERV